MATRAPRPRRTRIYGANYDIGESYYKKQLDNLDNKRFTNASDLRDTRSMPKVSFANNIADDEFFQTPPRKPFNLRSLEDEEPIKLSVKPYTPKIFLSHEMEDAADNIKREFGRKSFDVASEVKRSFLNDVENDIHEQFLPIRSKFNQRIEEDHHEVTATATATATSRARATKARLADLETEMLSITEKQNEREKRNSRLKKLLSEADAVDALAIL